MNFDFLLSLDFLRAIPRYGLAFLFVLTVVVFFHELGHFLVARLCGVRVMVFSVGFGRELFGFNDRHGTRWKFSVIPLGGYVKFFGDENAASVPDREALANMPEAERKQSFIHQKVGPRAAIVVAGPLANFILAIAIFAGLLLLFGRTYVKPRIDTVEPGTTAATAGFQKGDLILFVDGRAIESFIEVQQIIATNPGRPLEFIVDRKGQRVTLTATPDLRTERGHRLGRLDIGGPALRARVGMVQPKSAASAAGLQAGDVIEAVNDTSIETFAELHKIIVASPGKTLTLRVRRGDETLSLTAIPKIGRIQRPDGTFLEGGMLGIGSGPYDTGDVNLVRFGPLAAIGLGAADAWAVIDQTFTYLRGVFAGRAPADQLGGPIMIFEVSGQVASLGFSELLRLTALLSVSIGLLNLFPVPLLDGGHLLFYLIEVLRGRPLSEQAQEYGFRVGLVLVLMLMVFATYNDIARNVSRLWGS